jgi:hypothetical protein
MPNVLLEIYVLFTMSMVMFLCSVIILIFGHKRGTPNIIIWSLFPFIRGLHWLVESMAEYYDEILDKEMIILDQLELITAFCSSFILLAACIEHNGMIRKPIGKLAILLVALYPFYLLFTVDEDTLEKIEDVVLFRWGPMETDIFRFLYGFILPLVAIMILAGIFLYYYYHTKKGHINFNPKVRNSTIMISILIFLFSIFEGFDYYEETDLEIIFIGLRGITLAFFVIIPLIVILSQDLGLQKFFLIEHTGVPIFAYNFQEKSIIKLEDDISVLTSGFVSAIMSFSGELSERESGFLSVKLRYLNYIVLKTKSKLYALQTILTNRHLKNDFLSTIDKMEVLTSTIHQSSDIALNQVTEILKTNFSIYV